MDILKHKSLGSDLTSYDALKVLAIILMVVDHVGYYFFPDNDWLRVIGRQCVPIWFFLIGYAQTRMIPTGWFVGALILMISTYILEDRIFQINILLTMILVRLTLDFWGPAFIRNMPSFVIFSVIAGVLSLLTGFALDYGTLAMPLVALGLAARNGVLTPAHVFAAMLVFLMSQIPMFGFSQEQSWLLMGLLPIPFFLCYVFKPMALVKAPGFWAWPLQLIGRRTLEIYVIHILLFQLAAALIFS